MKQMFPKLDPQLQRDKSKFFLYFRSSREQLEKKWKDLDHQCSDIIINRFYSPLVLNTAERWITYLPLWSKIGFFPTGVALTGSITNATCESYFKDQKHSFHVKKQCRPDFIQAHALVVVNMVDRALDLGCKNVKN